MISNKISRFFRKKSVLVTGGTGLIGRQVVSRLVSFGAAVRVVSLDHLSFDTSVHYENADLTEFSTAKRLVQDMDIVLHLAGVKGSVKMTTEKPASFLVPLLMMNTNVLAACQAANTPHILYTSSMGAYPDLDVFSEDKADDGVPKDKFPGWAKRMGEYQIQAYKIQYGSNRFSIVRPGNVYGPGDNFDSENAMVIPALMARIAEGENPLRVWGDGSAVRDFSFSQDVADGILLAVYKGTQGQVVNLGSGQPTSIRELVETLQDMLSFDAIFDATKPTGATQKIMDISRARSWLGYDPQVTLKEGLRQTWEWYQNQKKESALRHNYFVETSH